MSLLNKLTSSTAPKAVLLIRLMVGAVFMSEGIQKFLFPTEVGAGRFVKIGLPWPEFLGPFVGSFEFNEYLGYPELKIMEQLSPRQLEEPSIAGYYGLVLQANGQRQKATA